MEEHMSELPGTARRTFGESLRDAERCLRLVIEQHQHHCNDYPECERCIQMQVEAKNAASALEWILRHTSV
jgi:hypothetical protein